MVPADNQQQYPQVAMPTLMDLRDSLFYLQEGPGLGIYNHGCSCYYRDNTLYLFPKFRTDTPGTDGRVAHMYLIPNWELGSGTSFHAEDEIGNLHLILNDISETSDPVAIGMENIGTALYLLDSPRLLHSDPGWMRPNGLQIPADLVELVELPSKRGFFAETHTPLYRANDGNSFKHRSILTANRNILMVATWEEAKPFQLYPGERIYCHYIRMANPEQGSSAETKQIHEKTASGIVNRAHYSFQRERQPLGDCYRCSASLILQLDEDL
jgi:hypothetical protein